MSRRVLWISVRRVCRLSKIGVGFCVLWDGYFIGTLRRRRGKGIMYVCASNFCYLLILVVVAI